MKEFVGALNSYHILNFIVPGVLFVIFLNNFSNMNLVQENAFIGIVLYYFVGMILSRIGSILITPIFKILKILKKYEYEDYLKASHVDKNINVLLEMNNMYRGLAAMAFVLLLLFAFEPFELNFDGKNSIYALLFILFFVLAFAWQKQNDYIKKRVETLKSINFILPQTKPSK